MEASDLRIAQELFDAALRAAGLTFGEDEGARLAREFREYLDDGRRLAASVPPGAEPLPAVRVEE